MNKTYKMFWLAIYDFPTNINFFYTAALNKSARL